jgi:deoxyadenosine/deoxycytidine kinase
MAYIVCIDGNIAAGKTTVLQEIEKKGYPVFYEPFQDNPWLPLYYQDPKKYALNTQIWFLSERFRQYKNADFSTRKIVFVERSQYTDRFIFVELIKQQGNMNDLEVDTYKHHFEIYKNPLPELTIILDTPPVECKDRMSARGRGMEEGVPLDYLQALGKVYDENYKRLGVKTVKKFFSASPSATAEEIIALAESEFAEYDR